MDASQYKDYIRVLLFVKYVSDKYAGDPGGLIEVPVGGSFADMVAAKGDDLLGDAYEYLMRHFATESGKSKGQFYTPDEVSRIMAMVIDLGQAFSGAQTIYHPTCGFGSLLLKAHDEAKSRTGLDLTIYGQEMDNATSPLARMNRVLHDWGSWSTFHPPPVSSHARCAQPGLPGDDGRNHDSFCCRRTTVPTMIRAGDLIPAASTFAGKVARSAVNTR